MLAAELYDQLVNFNLINIPVLSICMDNAFANDALVVEFKKKQIGIDNTQRLRCFAHVMNLACQDAINALTSKPISNQTEDPIVLRVRKIVIFIRGSNKRILLFESLQKDKKKLKLILDVETRLINLSFIF